MLEFEIDGRGVAHLWLNRPEVRNAFNAELISRITETVSALDDSVRVLVIGGRGKVFSAGADLDWMRSMAAYSSEENFKDSSKLEQMFAVIDHCRVPVVARVHGAALAGATGIVACCDVAVSAESAFFAFTEVKIGLIPAVISPYVVRKVGYSFARAAFMTGERFDARRALEVGLVHRVAPDESLDAGVDEAVITLLEGGPEALIKARDLVDTVAGLQPEEAAAQTVPMIAERRASAEGQEGIAAFLEKRPPSWRRVVD